MIEPFVAFGVIAGTSIVNNIIRTLLTRGHGVATVIESPVEEQPVKEALITVPPKVMKKYGNTEELPYFWFNEVWALVSTNKLIVPDSVIQEVFEARGRGKVAQLAFYEKYAGGAIDEKRIQSDTV